MPAKSKLGFDKHHEVFHHDDEVRGVFEKLPETPATLIDHLHPSEAGQPTASTRPLTAEQNPRGEEGIGRSQPQRRESSTSLSTSSTNLVAFPNNQPVPVVSRQDTASPF